MVDETDAVFDRVRDAAATRGVGLLRMERAAVTLEDEFLQSARGGGG